MDNLQLDQLQTASVVEELFGLREGSAFWNVIIFSQTMTLAFCCMQFVQARHGFFVCLLFVSSIDPATSR